MVIEARNLADRLREDGDDAKDLGTILQGLDALGYDEAAEYVYGIGYPEWKKRHSKKASDDQMQRFNDSKPLWAPIHKTALSKRSEANVQPAENASTYMSPPAALRRNYVEAHLPPPIVEKLEAGAFQSLAAHLRERSDEVQNIDLMTISGFCRNCLAKVSPGLIIFLFGNGSTLQSCAAHYWLLTFSGWLWKRGNWQGG